MTSYVNSTDVLNIPLNNMNSPIQTGEISSAISILNPIGRKRKNSSYLSNKSIKITHEESIENKTYKSEIDHLFNKVFASCKEAIVLSSLASKENLEILNPLFIETLLGETKEKKLRCYLEQDPFFGEYWKDLHRKNEKDNTEFSLQDLKKIGLCLESFSYPIPETVEEMLVFIKAKFTTDSVM